MRSIEERYSHLCSILGDIEVRLRGLQAKKAEIFNKLVQLDIEAGGEGEVIKTKSIPKR